MAKRNLDAYEVFSAPTSPSKRRTVNEDHARHLWETNQRVPWPNHVLPEGWNLGNSGVPVPQIPAEGRERLREIRRRRKILPPDLKFDPAFAETSSLWDTWFIPGVVPEARRRMWFGSVGPTRPAPPPPPPPPPPAQGQAPPPPPAPLPLEQKEEEEEVEEPLASDVDSGEE